MLMLSDVHDAILRPSGDHTQLEHVRVRRECFTRKNERKTQRERKSLETKRVTVREAERERKKEQGGKTQRASQLPIAWS